MSVIWAFISWALASLVGAAIAIIPQMLKEKREARLTYRAWLAALLAELSYLKKCIDEAHHQVGTTTEPYRKQMNTDLLKESRLVIFQHDEDIEFIESLTTVYSNVVLTNRNFDIYMERGDRSAKAINPVLDSLIYTRESILDLVKKIDQKLGHPYTEPALPLP